jgi:hypothetical protein
MGHKRTPAVHTGSEKLLSQPRDLCSKFEVQAHRRLRSLADAPEKGQWRWHNAPDILAPSMMTEKHAERRVEDMVEGGLVQPSSNRLLLIGTLCVKPRRD